MIYYIINESFTNIIAFVSILFAFAFTIAQLLLAENLLQEMPEELMPLTEVNQLESQEAPA